MKKNKLQWLRHLVGACCCGIFYQATTSDLRVKETIIWMITIKAIILIIMIIITVTTTVILIIVILIAITSKKPRHSLDTNGT